MLKKLVTKLLQILMSGIRALRDFFRLKKTGSYYSYHKAEAGFEIRQGAGIKKLAKKTQKLDPKGSRRRSR